MKETSPNEKPVGAEAGWQLLGKRIHFKNEVLTLREDTVRLPNKNETTFAYVERAEAVIIVPLTRAGELVMVNQYRYAVDEWGLEVPAGGTHDAPNESLEEVARKELREEVGGTCAKLRYVDYFYSAISITDEKCHIFLAEEVELSEKPEREASESLRTKLMPWPEALAFIEAGKMHNGACALAILLCAQLLTSSHWRRSSGNAAPLFRGIQP